MGLGELNSDPVIDIRDWISCRCCHQIGWTVGAGYRLKQDRIPFYLPCFWSGLVGLSVVQQVVLS